MSKIMYCEDCKDVVVAFPEAGKRRLCRCGRHEIRQDVLGDIFVRDLSGQYADPRVWIVGISWQFLEDPEPVVTPESVDKQLSHVRNSSLATIVKQANSLIVKYRPGEAGTHAYWDAEAVTKKSVAPV